MTDPESTSLAASFRYATAGILSTLVCQRNMKLHWIAAILVAYVASTLNFDLATRVVLLFCVGLVFFAELLNTAMEALVDLFTSEYHHAARLTKDAMAGSVLVLATGTALVFATIIFNYLDTLPNLCPEIQRTVALGVPHAAITAYLLFRRPTGFFNHFPFVITLVLALIQVRFSTSHIFSGCLVALTVTPWATNLASTRRWLQA